VLIECFHLPVYNKVSDLWVRQGGDWKLKFEQVTPMRSMY
jgi:hypothetical protein